MLGGQAATTMSQWIFERMTVMNNGIVFFYANFERFAPPERRYSVLLLVQKC